MALSKSQVDQIKVFNSFLAKSEGKDKLCALIQYDPLGFKNTTDPALLILLNRVQTLCMASYFSADHIVWAKNAGIYEDAEMATWLQKVSMLSWFGGSVCKAVGELAELARLVGRTNKALKDAETEEEKTEARAAADAEAFKRSLTITHASVQACLALGL